MSDRNLVEHVEAFAIKRVLDYLNDTENVDDAIEKAMDWVDRFDKKGEVAGQRAVFRKIGDSKQGNWYDLIKKVWTEIDPGVRGKSPVRD